MRFPHNTKIFRGQLDIAPFAGVFFLLLFFLMLHSSLVFTPGVEIRLPPAADLPGTDQPTAVVAVDANGLFYFENQLADEASLKLKLISAVAEAHGPLTLILQADRDVKYEVLVRLSMLARNVGIKDALLATKPEVQPRPLTNSIR